MTEVVRALIVDDEDRICFTLKEAMQRVGYVVTTASSGEGALEILREHAFDVAVLDLNLGGKVDGLSVLEAIRWRWPRTVVIMMTAHGSLESAVQAIQEGVDGYLLKPVRAAEVRRAVRQALERQEKRAELQLSGGAQHTLQRGPFAADLDSHRVVQNGKLLDLTPQEFTLLVYMMQNAGEAISPMDLVEVVRRYKPEYLNEARQIIKWYIHRLRKKVELDPSNPRYIVNVRGVGYLFEP